jgi:two-component SAPR family response regulator
MKRTVLIVDDDALSGLMAKDFVDSLGHQVAGMASNIDAAMSAVIEQLPNVVILNIKLGHESTAVLAARCRRLGVGVIFVSTYFERELPDWCCDAPALIKPYTREELFLALYEAEVAVGGTAVGPSSETETDGQRLVH